jgi:ABC-type glutathione transport system ATPase component
MRRIRGNRYRHDLPGADDGAEPVFTSGFRSRRSCAFTSGLSRRAARERAVELLDRVGLPDPPGGRTSIRPVVRGMRQRGMIAMAVDAARRC